MRLAKVLKLTVGLLLAVSATQVRAAGSGSVGTGSSGLGSLSGNVETDFPSTQSGVITLVNPRYPTTNPEQYLATNNMTTGWAIKDVRLVYDQPTDTLYVGLNFFGVAGDADGNGNPGTVSSAAAAKGAIDLPNLGGRESITVGFNLTGGTKPDFLAGVPQNKQQAGPGLIGFTFSAYQNLNTSLAQSYGTALTNHLGTLFFNPSAATPDFIFSVANFSQLPGYDPINGFGLVAYAGSPDDTYAEEGVLFPRVAFGRIPEPATAVAWSLATLAGIAWRVRARRRRLPNQS
jgi:hypothetical protein